MNKAQAINELEERISALNYHIELLFDDRFDDAGDYDAIMRNITDMQHDIELMEYCLNAITAVQE